MPEPIRLLLADAARVLGTTPDALRKKIKRGQLEAVRDNRGRLLVWVDPPAESGPLSRQSSHVQPGQVDSLSSQASSHVQPNMDILEDLRLQLVRAEVQAAADRQRADELAARLTQQRADHQQELERLRDEMERARMDADQWREVADRERQHSHALFERDIDLSNQLDRLHREHRAELKRALRPWWAKILIRK